MRKESKNIISIVIIISVVFFVFSCAPPPPGVYPPEARYVTASWYGPKFHGKKTASGEIFNMYAMTCAHKELPFGTRLRVTNPDNNKSVIVKVNDRGPFIPGRDLDLSYSAAKRIGLVKKGVGKVWMEYLGRDMSYVKKVNFAPSISPGPLTIQVGSFTEKSNAYRLVKILRFKYSNVYITTAYLKGRLYYRVRIGIFTNQDSAYSLAKKLAYEGYSTFITTKE